MNLPQNWNTQIIGRNGHVLNSSQWATFQSSIGRRPVFDINSNYYWLAFERQAFRLKYLLAIYCPAVNAEPTQAIESLKIKAADMGYDFLRLEPTGNITHEQMLSLGAHKIADVQPSHTRIIDLTKSEEELRAGLQSGHRNRINTASKRGVSVKNTKDLKTVPHFLRLLADTASRAKISNHPDWYYEKMAQSMIAQNAGCFYIASAEGNPASISLIFDWGNTRYYAHTGNDQLLNRQYKAAVSNVWQMILDAKADGKKHFDLWGVAPPEAKNHSWAGISEFKAGFGGEVVANIGTYDIAINKPKYKMYETYKKLRGRT